MISLSVRKGSEAEEFLVRVPLKMQLLSDLLERECGSGVLWAVPSGSAGRLCSQGSSDCCEAVCLRGVAWGLGSWMYSSERRGGGGEVEFLVGR
jgi:hypothetical protein